MSLSLEFFAFIPQNSIPRCARVVNESVHCKRFLCLINRSELVLVKTSMGNLCIYAFLSAQLCGASFYAFCFSMGIIVIIDKINQGYLCNTNRHRVTLILNNIHNIGTISFMQMSKHL